MQRLSLFVLIPLTISVFSQTPILDSWMLNTDGTLTGYWENVNGNYIYTVSSDSANVLSVCYTNDSVWVRANGLPDSTGKYSNPGIATAQHWTFRFPKNPQAATTLIECPNVGVIGVLINGIPIYGKGDATSWSNTSQTNETNGQGIWNVDAWFGEGHTLDSAYGAHPAQSGDYHTHATPKLLYDFPSTTHSPIVGFALDGYPIYGPFGYSDPMDSLSGISQMEPSYALRNITKRNQLPSGTMLAQQDWGPDVDTNHPLGEYGEDYEYVASSGDLDEYNGRFCITPEYPNGTYAYFVTADTNGSPLYPYYLGREYYGIPDSGVFYFGAYDIQIPQNAICIGVSSIDETEINHKFKLYPNPSTGNFRIELAAWNTLGRIEVTDNLGRVIYKKLISSDSHQVQLGENTRAGIYFIRLITNEGKIEEVQKLILD